ncbi:hypothetical protein QAS_4091 [Clostridioides difficile CD9]|uniref:hypothetical protein n=1 Tax=Clostridioides difficile TaxID=1496 RepID=UPI00038D7F8D|nr:hypothetical protein [Clostridioides difficile]EQE00566.1 hypothetical protein QAS_4091 [Clostridioides difficile CD9]
MESNFGILSIPDSTNYWLVRANGGQFLSDYIENGFMSLAHNLVTTKQIKDPNSPKNVLGDTDIRQIYANNYPQRKKRWITTASIQCNEFINEMNIGDVVLTPGYNSDEFAVGVVISDAYDADFDSLQSKKKEQVPNGLSYSIDMNIKRRDVAWFKIIRRESLPGELYWVLSAHQAIFNISKYSSYVNTLIFPLFKASGKLNLVVHTTTEKELLLSDWRAISNISEENVEMQADVHCPGILQFAVAMAKSGAIDQIIHSLSVIAGVGLTGSGIYTFIYLLIGKKGREMGLVEWVMNLGNMHREAKLKKINLDQKITLKKNPSLTGSDIESLKKLKLTIDDVGTAIQKKDHSKKTLNEHQTESTEENKQ